MQAIREIIKPENHKITISLPESFGDEEVEVIVISAEKEGITEEKEKFDPRKFRGALKLNMTVDEIDQECRKMREEWERGF